MTVFIGVETEISNLKLGQRTKLGTTMIMVAVAVLHNFGKRVGKRELDQRTIRTHMRMRMLKVCKQA